MVNFLSSASGRETYSRKNVVGEKQYGSFLVPWGKNDQQILTQIIFENITPEVKTDGAIVCIL